MSVKKWLVAAALLGCSFFICSLDACARYSGPAQDTLPAHERGNTDTSFPGGQAAWQKRLEANIDPNVPVKNGAPDGQYIVYVQFIIGENGDISDVKPLTNHGYGMEQEVVRNLQKNPSWTPATENREPIKVYRNYRKVSVTFSILTEGRKKKRNPASRRSYITIGS